MIEPQFSGWTIVLGTTDNQYFVLNDFYFLILIEHLFKPLRLFFFQLLKMMKFDRLVDIESVSGLVSLVTDGTGV